MLRDITMKAVFVGWIVCGGALGLKAHPIRLASDGAANYRIFTADSSRIASEASEELKKYLAQLSGAVFADSDGLTGRTIVVGTALTIKRHSAAIDIPLLTHDSYGLLKRGHTLYLLGGSERSIWHAVYDFLSRLGCRWIAPEFTFYEGKDKYVPVQPRLDYRYAGDIIERPAFNYRKLYIEEGLSHNVENLLQLIRWMPKARFNVLVAPIDYQGHGRAQWDNWRQQLIPELKKRGIGIEVGGHGYQNFLHAGMEDGRLYTDHPEWFGMDPDGHRSAEPHIVFCTSNAEAVAYLNHRIGEYLDGHPEIDIFDFWPPDNEKWCACERCEALGTATERHALLVSETASYLKNNYPDVKLECLAYHHYTEPPQHTTLDKSVLLDFCPINQQFEYQIYEQESENNKRYNESLRRWMDGFGGDISIYSYYRKYAWRSLPNVIPHYMQRDLIYYRDMGIKGISVYSEPGDWFTFGLNHYVLGNLAWNPGIHVDSLIQGYCTTLYGEAAALVGDIYTELEDIVRFGCNIPFSAPKTVAAYEAYIARLLVCGEQLEAATANPDLDPVTHRHLKRVALMVGYATASTRTKMLGARGAVEEANRVAQDMKQTINENKHAGVFIPR